MAFFVQVITHSRQTLVQKLDAFSFEQPELFATVISALEEMIYPVIERHALAGKCKVPLQETPFCDDAVAMDMAICVLSDRGFRVFAVTETWHVDSRALELVVKWEVPQLRAK